MATARKTRQTSLVHPEDPAIAAWLRRDPDPTTRAKLQELLDRGDEAELRRAFAGRLEFGTAGLRGIIGVGPARMNRLVVRETTAGLAAYLGEKVAHAAQRGVVIGHDCRRMSPELAEDCAAVLAALGFKSHVFSRPVPTPLCAFAVRELGAAAGIVITASHNGAEYNGYKVYWENGAQIIPPDDAGIAHAIATAAAAELPPCDFASARARGLIAIIGEDLIEAYLAGVAALSLHQKSPARARLRIAYTALHGVGAELAERALERAGFTEVFSVPSQREPDGRFPTVTSPNPEEPGARAELFAHAAAVGAELAVANDPDADRLFAAVRTPDGSYRALSGDELGVLLGHDRMIFAPPQGLVITSIVSSRMLASIARAHGVAYAETLTGCKWIANEAIARAHDGLAFIFGYEEALGYCIGELVRDKDGIAALVALAELVAHLAESGRTLLDELALLSRRHGLHKTHREDLALAGASFGEVLRASPPARVGGRRVLVTTDVLASRRSFADGREEPLALPQSDVLIYELEGDARVVVRPSGTEPKMKCYYEVRLMIADDEPMSVAEQRGEAVLAKLVQAHHRELDELLPSQTFSCMT